MGLAVLSHRHHLDPFRKYRIGRKSLWKVGTYSSGSNNHFIFEVGIAFTVAAFLILTSERVLKTEMELKFAQYLADIRAEATGTFGMIDQKLESYATDFRSEYRTSLRTLSHIHRFSHFLNDLQGNDNIGSEVRALANEILRDYSTGIRTLEDGFAIEERNWTMEVMKRFYRKLQEPECRCRNAEIRITHPGPIGIWKHQDAVHDTLIAQRELVRHKNVTLKRIFVGTEQISPQLDDQSEHAEIINEMGRYDILRYYVRRSETRMPMDITWVPRLGIFMQWVRRPEGGAVEEVIIRSDARARKELEPMWQTLLEDVSSNGFEAPDNPMIAERLRLNLNSVLPMRVAASDAQQTGDQAEAAE